MCWLLGLFYILMMLLYLFLLSYPAEHRMFSSAGRRALGSVFCFMASCRFCSSGLSLSLMRLLFELEGAVVLMPGEFIWG